MFYNFTDDARRALVNAKKEMMNLKHPYVGTEHLLLALLKQKNTLSNKLYKLGLNYSLLKKKLIELIGVGNNENNNTNIIPNIPIIISTI